MVAEDHGIDLGNDDSSTSGGNVVVINAGAVVRGDTAVKFDNGGNTLTVSGLLDGGFEAVGQNNEITISSSGSITTTGDYAYGIYNKGDTNTTTVSGSIRRGVMLRHLTVRHQHDHISGALRDGDERGIYNEATPTRPPFRLIKKRVMKVAFLTTATTTRPPLWQYYDDW